MKNKIFLLLALSIFLATGCDIIYSGKNGFAAWSTDLRGTSWESVNYLVASGVSTTESTEAEEKTSAILSYLIEQKDVLEFSKKANKEGLYQLTKSRYIVFNPLKHENFNTITNEDGTIIEHAIVQNSSLINNLTSKLYIYNEGFTYKNFPASATTYLDEKVILDVWIGKNQRGEIVYYPKGFSSTSYYYNFTACLKTTSTNVEYVKDPVLENQSTTSESQYSKTIIVPYKGANAEQYCLISDDSLVWEGVTYKRVKGDN